MIKKSFLALVILLFLPINANAAKEEATVPANRLVVLETTLGTIKIQLDDEKAPISTANFRQYVREGFYDGLIFHRVIPGFMIQGGGFEPGMKKKIPTHAEIKNEADNGLKNKRGTIAMARTNKINSASSQFFINVVNNSFLNHRSKLPQQFGYAVFGKVVEGMDIADKIAAVATGRTGGFRDVPKKDVVILKAFEE